MKNNNQFENLQIGQKIYMIGQQNFPKTFPPHWHNCIEVITLPEGINSTTKPEIIVNQTTYSIAPGDFIFIWPGELHEIRGNDAAQLVGLQFSDTLFLSIQDFAPFWNLFRTYRHVLAAEQPELSQTMSSYLKHMLEISREKSLFPTVEQVICLYELFMALGTHLHNKVNSTEDKLFSKIDRACQYIQENCTQNITLDSVADYVGFSSCYFSRIFKQTVRYSFVDYLNIQRVKNAQALLGNPALNVTEISYQSGFKSISTFNRVFHQFRGCSPTEYRKYYADDMK